MDIFSRYAPFVQDFIYQNSWENLRGVQVAAGDVLFNTEDNLLLCASTASGKTEAAFFPILTMLSENPPASVGCLYIAPLKALINDQFARLTDLCEEGDIPVWHWHGDVSASHKRRLLRRPSGILQITPESLEAMLLRRHGEVARLFADLRFVVIDEIHSLLRADRGLQTLCLIERLSRMAGVNPRRIGLSATVGDPQMVGRFLAAGSGRRTAVPKVKAPGMKWRLSMEHFYLTPPQAADELKMAQKARQAGPETVYEPEGMTAAPVPLKAKSGLAADLLPAGKAADRDLAGTAAKPDAGSEDTASADTASAGDKALTFADPGCAYIFEHTRGRKCLVFSNSREECEAVTSTLRSYCEATHEPDRFLIHHGNLSASLRESAEEDMRDEDSCLTTCTTATLELGIDIGRLERAFQIDAPFTVSSFLQRMGRTGRRGDPEEMWFVMREEHPEPRSLVTEKVPWPLLQGIALIQLYLEEKWVEPPRTGRLPYSLLYHQTMSILASGGEMTAAQLAGRVLTLPPFHNISQDDYRILLRHLIETDHIQRTEEGGLIVGLAGERVTGNFRFFAVFQDNEEFSVRCDSQELGTIVKPPPVGEKIAIAGRVWVVEDIDIRRRQIYCSPVKGKVPAYFGDVPGDIHTRILQRMRQVLDEEIIYPYLRTNARARLAGARAAARRSRLTAEPLICLGGNMYALIPWLGTYSFLALERFLRLRCAEKLGLRGFTSARPYYMQFTMHVTPAEFYEIIQEEAEKPFSPIELLFPKEVPYFDKYDEYIPEELVKKGFACGVLDTAGMKEWISRIRKEDNRS